MASDDDYVSDPGTQSHAYGRPAPSASQGGYPTAPQWRYQDLSGYNIGTQGPAPPAQTACGPGGERFRGGIWRPYEGNPNILKSSDESLDLYKRTDSVTVEVTDDNRRILHDAWRPLVKGSETRYKKGVRQGRFIKLPSLPGESEQDEPKFVRLKIDRGAALLPDDPRIHPIHEDRTARQSSMIRSTLANAPAQGGMTGPTNYPAPSVVTVAPQASSFSGYDPRVSELSQWRLNGKSLWINGTHYEHTGQVEQGGQPAYSLVVMSYKDGTFALDYTDSFNFDEKNRLVPARMAPFPKQRAFDMGRFASTLPALDSPTAAYSGFNPPQLQYRYGEQSRGSGGTPQQPLNRDHRHLARSSESSSQQEQKQNLYRGPG